jgi:hypothetical protein
VGDAPAWLININRSPEEIDRLICEGLDDIDRGDMIDGEEAFRQLRAKSSALRAAIDEGDARGIAKGNVFSRVRKKLNLTLR